MGLRFVAQLGYVLFRMARPAQVLLIFFVYCLGVLMAVAQGFPLEADVFWIGALALIMISLSIHFANEYADYETDLLTTRTLFSGGSGVLPETGLPRHLALIAAWIALCVGGALSIGAAWVGVLNRISLFVLAFGAIFGWMYSLPPLALAWRGWGELDNALIGSIALPFYGYVVHTGRFDWVVILACLPFFGLAFTNLLATTWTDREADAAVGKCTLATRWPILRLRVLYLTVVAGSFSLLLLLHSWGFPPIVVWSSFLVLPVAIWGTSTYTRIRNPFPSVAAMVLMLFVQLVAWWSVADFCCLKSVIGYG